MRQSLNRLTLKLFFGHMANDMLYAGLPPLLPVLAAQRNLSVALLGLIPSVYMICSSFLQIPIGSMYDRQRFHRVMAAGLILNGASIASLGFLDNYYLMVAAAGAAGVGSALFHPIATSLSSVSSKRSVSVSFFMTGGDLGLTLGSFVSVLAVAALGLNGTAVMFAFPFLMALLLYRIEPDVKQSVEKKVAKAVRTAGYRSLALLVGTAILRGVAVMSVITYLPLYLTSVGLPIIFAGSALTVMLLAGAAGMVTGGILAARFGSKNVALIHLLISSAMLLMIPFSKDVLVIITAAVLGFSILAIHPLLVAISHDLMPHNLGIASAIMYGFTLGISNIAVPVIGLLIENLGYSNVFLILTAAPLTASVLLLNVRAGQKKLQQTSL